MGNSSSSRCCGDDFSEDIFIQILVWLPVVSLLRFKSVCKSWRTLIESPFFIDLHTTTITTPSNSNSNSSSSKFGSFILHAFILWSAKHFMLSSGSGSGSGSGDDDDIILNDKEEKEKEESGSGDDDDNIDNDKEEKEADYLGFPPCVNVSRLSHFHVGMVGSCNGLICIYNHIERVATLWNPATRQCRILPKSIPIKEKDEVMGRFCYDFVAFGFDVKTKDYKVVKFSCFIPPLSYLHRRIGDEVFCIAQVYSLSTDSWRLLEGINSLPVRLQLPPHQNQGIYMNGCYFFVGKDESQVFLSPRKIVCNNSLVYSFDFTKEILTTVQCPDHDSRHDLILGYLGEKNKMVLFVIQRNLLIGGGSEFHDCGLDYEYYDIWVLNDEQQPGGGGVVKKESWTKLHSFPKINRFKHPSQPRWISSNGEFALISTRTAGGGSELQLFNLVTKEAKKFLTNNYNIFRSDAYKQSLVSIIAAPTTASR